MALWRYMAVKPMTSTPRRRVPGSDDKALRFLIEEFIHQEVDGPEPTPKARRALLTEAARLLLPSPEKGFSHQQMTLIALDSQELTELRREMWNWLERIVCETSAEGPVALRGPRIMVTPVIRGRPGNLQLLVEGRAVSVFWYYIVSLLSRVGLEAIGVCRAPQARYQVPCLRLFVRRGKAKEYCSEQCRARVATQRARGIVRLEL
jgi:hypothetical protein